MGTTARHRPLTVLLAIGALACRSAQETRHSFPMLEDAIPVAAEPVLGQPLPFKAAPQFELTFSSSEKRPAYVIWVGEILYDAAVDEQGRVVYLSTSHPSFKSPEGLHVGSSLEEARAAGAGGFAPDHGWACYADLPSGWKAGTRLAAPPQTCETKIAWFFKGWPRPLMPDAIPLAALPELGQPLPFQAPPMAKLIVSGSNMEDAYHLRVDGITYEAAVDDERKVSYLATWDPAFRAPEGLHVGDSVDDARAAGATGFAYEHMGGCSAELPSGWRAGAEFVGQPLICHARISWFFKRN